MPVSARALSVSVAFALTAGVVAGAALTVLLARPQPAAAAQPRVGPTGAVFAGRWQYASLSKTVNGSTSEVTWSLTLPDQSVKELTTLNFLAELKIPIQEGVPTEMAVLEAMDRLGWEVLTRTDRAWCPSGDFAKGLVTETWVLRRGK